MMQHAPTVRVIKRRIRKGEMPGVHRFDFAAQIHEGKTAARLLDAGGIEIDRSDVGTTARPVHCQRAKPATDLEHFLALVLLVGEKPVEWSRAMQGLVPAVELQIQAIEKLAR